MPWTTDKTYPCRNAKPVIQLVLRIQLPARVEAQTDSDSVDDREGNAHRDSALGRPYTGHVAERLEKGVGRGCTTLLGN